MSKGPDAFRTISEVGDDLDVPQHVLRFWETRFPAIRPLKRGGGRRYYRPDDVELLRGIRHLLYGQGYTIKGVQRILKEDGLRTVQAIGRGEPATALHPPAAGEDEVEAPGEGAAPGWVAAEPGEAAGEPADIPRSVPRGSGLADDSAATLLSALDELLECQRILAGLKAG